MQTDKTPTKPVKIITFRKIVIYTFLVEMYNVIIMLLEIILHTESAVKGAGFLEVVSMFVYTIIPDLVIVFNVFMIVFYGPARSRLLQSRMPCKVISDVILSLAVAFVVYKLFHLILQQFNPVLKINWNEAFVNVTLILLIVEIIYYALYFRATVKQVEEARSEALQYRYNVLKAQVNPHFLFNSLNILSSLVSIDVRKSEEFIAALSGMYRYVIDSQDRSLVPLSEELDSLKCYVSILKMRYCNQLEVSMSGQENAEGKKIVPMTMQLLIENVTKHNVVSTKYPMLVTVEISPQYVSVSNPVRRRNADNGGAGGSGVGLRYISEQYRLNGKEVGVSDEGDVFTVRIPYI